MFPTLTLLLLAREPAPTPKPAADPTAETKPAEPVSHPCTSRAGCKWEGEPVKTRVAKKPQP